MRPVTVIGLDNGKMDGTSTLAGFSSPAGVAATPNGKQLLVSCAGDGTVRALDPDHLDLGQHATLPVGGAPGMIAMLPGGAYAAVANAETGAISLIDCSGQPRDARVAGPPVPVGAQWAGITASPDGLQVFVPVARGFAVVTLATPVDFGHPHNDPVHVVLALAVHSPEHHLGMVAELANLFNNSDAVERLAVAATADQVRAILGVAA